MRSKRLVFKNSFENCKRKEQRIHESQLLSNVRQIICVFWRELKSWRNDIAAPADMIDGVGPSQDIANLFAERFSSITASDTNVTVSDTIVTTTDTNVTEGNFRFAGLSKCPTVISLRDLREAVSNSKPGIGLDGMRANHLKILNDENLGHIADFFNMSLAHGYFSSKC